MKTNASHGAVPADSTRQVAMSGSCSSGIRARAPKRSIAGPAASAVTTLTMAKTEKAAAINVMLQPRSASNSAIWNM